jgi:excisionase family DNA binding protein
MTKRNKGIPFEQRITCTVAQAKEYTGIRRSKIWMMIDDGRLQTTRVDGARLIFVKSILAVLGHQADAADAAP